MRRRQPPLPTVWLMTDERLGDALWVAVRHLPRGAGVVFRHHATPELERRRLFARLVREARARRLVVIRAGAPCGYGASGVHKQRPVAGGLRTMPVHTVREARQMGPRVDAVFVSPVFATRSHPGGRALGVRGAEALARSVPVAAVALGGMDAGRFRRLRGFVGWAGIDVWLG
jgi:thiamine-phosphate pyrophosphorylase